MRILIVASGNTKAVSPFIIEQVESLKKIDIHIEYFLIKGKGWTGYLKSLSKLKKKIKNKKFNLIHAHYGLSGLLATLQRKIPVIITFHGSDININKNYKWSFIASRLSSKNIFVHKDQPKKLKVMLNEKDIIPCGINLKIFQPKDKVALRKKLNWDQNKVYILFSSSFDKPVKNVNLAYKSTQNIKNSELIELKNYTKIELSNLMNAADLLLVTSFSETGPLIVKEAIACNCPVVSTDVGDVKEIIVKRKNSFVTSYNPKEIEAVIKKVIKLKKPVPKDELTLQEYDLNYAAQRIKVVYQECLKNNG
jgi:glycosyltransferase involved in cell wall biosynthesis|tara:strand:+ start:5545 stop:6468 length:924 start_codon:yes stop_codon:yes gene_type:complete